MKHYNFLDRPALKLSIFKRLQYILVGLLLLLIDAGILYVLYESAAWVSSIFNAPAVVTVLLVICGLLVFGGITIILLVLGVVALFIGVVG